MIVVCDQTASIDHACVLTATVVLGCLQLSLLGKTITERLGDLVHVRCLIRLILGLIK